ncbi:IS630 family transposase [Hymenobacter piscis]|uniref:IS630 family transposase n=1 Tax=Hymenobacter piscis TaxID=2839984 RepID=UPI001FE5C10D|nr:IS630 family transposase [Hymenobacter piscis]
MERAQRAGLTPQKKSLHATERDTPRVRTARAAHVATVCTRPDVARFHFLDETALRLDESRRYARAKGGQRVGEAIPLNRGKSLTLIGALSVKGLGGMQVLDGALNQHRFAWYVTHCLAPTRRRGDVLVLDNASAHKLEGVKQWLAERGVELLFLPPYSPDFNPVEQAWSKLKTKLRAAQARTREALLQALQAAIDWITSADALGWFDHCGYHATAG